MIGLACVLGGADSRAEARDPAAGVLAAPAPAGDVASQWRPAQARLQDEQNTIDVFRAVAPATVFVTQSRRVHDFSMRALEVPAGQGSGFIWDRSGHIVTNFHVIGQAARNITYSVTLYNHKTYPARVIGGEPARDIAVLKIDAPASELQPIRVQRYASALEVGQKTLAIGNPFGLDNTLTTGIVSALGREIVGYGGVTIRDMIQTDASINPGNSGGPLIDSGGDLIGMNTMIYSKSGSSSGIGFAVPVTTIKRVVPQIIKYGHIKRAGLGVTIISDDVARSVGIQGVVINEVRRGSPAAKAGIRGLQRGREGIELGDVIIGINADPIHSYDDLYNALEKFHAGDEVSVKLRREGRSYTAKLKLVSIQ